jgi:hypothetical protein
LTRSDQNRHAAPLKLFRYPAQMLRRGLIDSWHWVSSPQPRVFTPCHAVVGKKPQAGNVFQRPDKRAHLRDNRPTKYKKNTGAKPAFLIHGPARSVKDLENQFPAFAIFSLHSIFQHSLPYTWFSYSHFPLS